MKTIHIALGILILTAVIALAQQVVTYRCPRCSAIQQFQFPGQYKCPRDGALMLRQF